MQILQTIGGVAGGIGLFLLAMKLMTDGLKLAGGDALREALRVWTSTPIRGLAVGALVTALVQSSSAVTVATIGFVNAGLMTLFQAVGVIYGANVGTTMTAWLVAALGFKIKVKLFALPLIGIGTPVWLLSKGTRLGAVGQAIVGFGLFFIGIDTLKSAFDALAPTIDFAGIAGAGPLGLILLVGVGFLVTLLTQSSSAAIAITLTAASEGVLPLSGAAAAVIGANVGTTSTSFFATLNATPNARRVATAHIVFNAVTAAVAFLLLPFILRAVAWFISATPLESTSATTLALFHTSFNLLGVAVLWPWTRKLVSTLEGSFRTDEEDERRLQYLDRTAMATPALAVNALLLETSRVDGLVRGTVENAMSGEATSYAEVEKAAETVDVLVVAIGESVAQLGKDQLAPNVAAALPDILRVSQLYGEMCEYARELWDLHRHVASTKHLNCGAQLQTFLSDARAWLLGTDVTSASFSIEAHAAALGELHTAHLELTQALVQCTLAQELDVDDLGPLLEELSTVERLLRTYMRAVQMLRPWRLAVHMQDA